MPLALVIGELVELEDSRRDISSMDEREHKVYVDH
jgi:hypothetical protein